MKIFIINGSPKGENSHTLPLARALAAGMGGEIGEFHIANEDIRPCTGCFSCWGETAGKCIIDDSVKTAIAGILEADVIIESFPLYFCGVPGQMKVLTDRLIPMILPFVGKPMPENGESFLRLRHKELKNKKLFLVSTCGYGETEGMYASVKALYDSVCGKEGYTAFFVPQGELYGIGSLEGLIGRRTALMTAAGKEFLENGNISRETVLKATADLVPRRAFENITLARWGNTVE